MKKLSQKLWAKITAVFVFSFSLAFCAASMYGVVYLVYVNAFADDGWRARQNIVSGSLFWQEMDYARRYYETTAGLLWSSDPSFYEKRFSAEQSNFYFTVQDEGGNILLENYKGQNPQFTGSMEYQLITSSRDVSELLSFPSDQERYAAFQRLSENYCSYVRTWEEELENNETVYWLDITYTVNEYQTLTFTGHVKSELSAPDYFQSAAYWMDALVRARHVLIALSILLLILTIAVFIFLLCGAGRKEGVEGIHLNWLHRTPFGLYLLSLVLTGLFSAFLFEEALYGNPWSYALIVLYGLFVLIPLSLSLPVTFAARVKAGRFWRYTLCWMICHFLWRLCRGILFLARSLPLYWKAGLLCAGITILELVTVTVCRYEPFLQIIICLAENYCITILVAVAVINMRRLQKAGQELASGNLAHSVNLRHMLWDFKKHGENLNSIRSGMALAVDSRLKSERLKTELITNVSHDIKTPLTSIINYVELLKQPDVTPEQSTEYIGVLDRQSRRLKKLTEDLVEASKASTGNIQVDFENVCVNLLLNQAAGEYESRLAQRRLEIVLNSASGPSGIRADGKLLWRVFDNLLSNISKYAMEGTRVYLSAETAGDTVSIVFKNVSAHPLNMPGEELMERFVRGDASRSADGSGLGLSIAKSLTELQGGCFDIAVDGDLFKAIIVFPAF